MIYCFRHKLTIVTSSILEMLRTRVFTLTIVGPSLPVSCETMGVSESESEREREQRFSRLANIEGLFLCHFVPIVVTLVGVVE